jgi:FAD/FMN-containing dehydrogenase
MSEEALAWASGAGAKIAFVHAPIELRQSAEQYSLWAPLPPSLPIMRRLKATLDPNGTLNPGRFLAGI